MRGLRDELIERGHPVEALAAGLSYDPERLDPAEALDDADVVLVQGWHDPEWVRRLGACRGGAGSPLLLFHETDHRSITDRRFEPGRWLEGYDGVLAFAGCLAQVYRDAGWARRVWVWHEAADVRRFRPQAASFSGDLVWIGDGDDAERTGDLEEFLVAPVRALGLSARVYGDRYSPRALRRLERAGIRYAGPLAGERVPEVYSRFRVVLHIPSRPVARTLPGVPTSRVFEALACGRPLLCAPWEDSEKLFEAGSDYLVASDGAQATEYLHALLTVPSLARGYAERGLAAIHARHTCGHRADELLAVCRELGLDDSVVLARAAAGVLLARSLARQAAHRRAATNS